MLVKIYDELPQEAIKIRKEVFMEEQGFENEFDELDQKSKHVVLFDEEIPIATCRFYYCQERKCFIIGRVAVDKTERGKKYGAKVIQSAESEIENCGGKIVMLLAQYRAHVFYEKLGYKKQNETCLDEGCLHVWMKKELK